MAERKRGKVIYRKTLSPLLEIFRVAHERESPFQHYDAGQYAALSRDDCKLTKKITDQDGKVNFVYDLDDRGNLKHGQVTRHYSIASAPFETEKHGYLEFYVVLELIKLELPGQLSESLFHINPVNDSAIFYSNEISGDFTLEKRAPKFENIVMVGTGSGLAPFVSIMKQTLQETVQGKKDTRRFTLFHTNRSYQELGYHQELLAIEASKKIDFIYVPSVSRPTNRDYDDATIGKGRANNLLRTVFKMPLKEQREVEDTQKLKKAPSPAAVQPVLPAHISREVLLERMNPQHTVILTCGNQYVMDDIRYIADQNGIRFEKEEW